MPPSFLVAFLDDIVVQLDNLSTLTFVFHFCQPQDDIRSSTVYQARSRVLSKNFDLSSIRLITYAGLYVIKTSVRTPTKRSSDDKYPGLISQCPLVSTPNESKPHTDVFRMPGERKPWHVRHHIAPGASNSLSRSVDPSSLLNLRPLAGIITR